MSLRAVRAACSSLYTSLPTNYVQVGRRTKGSWCAKSSLKKALSHHCHSCSARAEVERYKVTIPSSCSITFSWFQKSYCLCRLTEIQHQQAQSLGIYKLFICMNLSRTPQLPVYFTILIPSSAKQSKSREWNTPAALQQ